MKIAAAAFLIAVAAVSLFGWGELANRIAGYRTRNLPLTMAIGLAVFLFLGGVLNLLRIAYGPSLDSVLLGGIVAAAFLGRSRISGLRDRGAIPSIAAAALVVAAILAFTLTTQLPPRAFNYHDDFEKYFSHPVRMLQTGTAFGSPLSAIGFETLGGQAFLHATILNHFPIPFINGADSVFGLFLSLLLAGSIVPRSNPHIPVLLLSMLTVFFIHPQYVNTSALYLGSALMMASILVLAPDPEHGNADSGELPSPVPIALLHSALIALKSSFLLFPTMQIFLFLPCLLLLGARVRRMLRWLFATASLTILFLAPWLLLHLPHYIRSSGSSPKDGATTALNQELHFFSPEKLPYGASYAHYTLLLSVVSAFLAAIAILACRRIHDRERRIPFAWIVASGGSVVFCVLLLIASGPFLAGYQVSLRYAIPFLIAGVPAAMSFAWSLSLQENERGRRRTVAVLVIIAGLGILAAFANPLAERIRHARIHGNILAIPPAADHGYLAYNEQVLSGDMGRRIAGAQDHVPAGQPFVAWVSAPFHFDYGRNAIFDADPSGIANPWAYIPKTEYIILEYRGNGVRPIDQYERYFDLSTMYDRKSAFLSLEFLRIVLERSDKGKKLFDDGGIAVFRIPDAR